MSAPNENEIDIGAMPLDQLNGLKQQLETESGGLTNNFANLKEAQVRFLDSKQSLEGINSANKGDVGV
jgi:hypothetical protein